MREAVTRRYRRLQEEKKPLPSLILIDGGIGQLHAAAAALESLQIINQPLASIAKKEEILYIYGQENEPCILDRHSPVLHLIQQIRDETHRFAVTFHRQRRGKRQTKTTLSDVPGVGPRTVAETPPRIRQRSQHPARRNRESQCGRAAKKRGKNPRAPGIHASTDRRRITARTSTYRLARIAPPLAAMLRFPWRLLWRTMLVPRSVIFSLVSASARSSAFFSRRNPVKTPGIILSKKADEGKDYAQRKARELRERADELIERSKDVAVRKKDSLSAAVEAGREAYLRESSKS